MNEVAILSGPVTRREEMILGKRCSKCAQEELVIQGEPHAPAVVGCYECETVIVPEASETRLLIKIRALARKVWGGLRD